MVGLEGFEPPTHGLGNHDRTVLPVRNNAFAVGYDTSHSAPRPQFVHQYAPNYAPHPVTREQFARKASTIEAEHPMSLTVVEPMAFLNDRRPHQGLPSEHGS
jgi:hypothetical protein